MFPRLLPLFLALSSTLPAAAHEFWIDPIRHGVAVGEPVEASLRVGERFEGIEIAYLPAGFRRFEIAQGDSLLPVTGRMGDRPALGLPAPGEGLAVVIHVTTDTMLTYRDYATFESFVTHKDATWALARHDARGLPRDKIREVYSRHAKALVAVGHGAGEDRAFGLETELVAEANPYTDDVADGLPIRLFYQGAPRVGAQVEVFESGPGGITVTTLRTDDEGRARVAVRAGHRYMLDAVVLRVPGDAGGAMWESLWANLTFAVPG